MSDSPKVDVFTVEHDDVLGGRADVSGAPRLFKKGERLHVWGNPRGSNSMVRIVAYDSLLGEYTSSSMKAYWVSTSKLVNITYENANEERLIQS